MDIIDCSKVVSFDSLHFTMRLQILGLLIGLWSLVNTLSLTGNKVLVIHEDDSDRAKYAHFWDDLQGESARK